MNSSRRLRSARLSGEGVFTDLFDPRSEFDVGHIRLARDTDLIVVAPATADLMAKMAGGHADDLATAVLLATDKPVLLAPAMNPRMWEQSGDPAQPQRSSRPTACASSGPMRARWPKAANTASAGWRSRSEIVAAIDRAARQRRHRRPLAGKRVLITSGPTHEPIDPVRYIANRSSGKQGHAIAAAAAAGRRRCDIGRRAGTDSRSGGCPHYPCADRARDAGGGGEGASRRHRHLCRRRCRLGHCRAGRTEDQEEQRGHPCAFAGRESRHSRDASRSGNRSGPGWSSALPPKPKR